MNLILAGIIITVFGGLILTGIICALKVRFYIRPKLQLRYVSGIKQSSSSGPGKLRCEWQGTLSLYNPTPHDAFDVTFVFPSNWSLPKPQLEPPHVGTKETKRVSFNVAKSLNLSEVFPHEHEPPRPDFNPPHVVPLRDFYPEELKRFSLSVRYSNGRGLSFYSLLTKDAEKQNSSTRRFRPKL